MTRPISDLDVPLTTLQRELRDLVARQRAQGTDLADRSSQRLTAVLAPTQPDTIPNPTAEEAS